MNKIFFSVTLYLRKPSVTLRPRSPLSAEFWMHCILSGGAQRRIFPRYQSEEKSYHTSVKQRGASVLG